MYINTSKPKHTSINGRKHERIKIHSSGDQDINGEPKSHVYTQSNATRWILNNMLWFWK
jgi:hypothetical protein